MKGERWTIHRIPSKKEHASRRRKMGAQRSDFGIPVRCAGSRRDLAKSAPGRATSEPGQRRIVQIRALGTYFRASIRPMELRAGHGPPQSTTCRGRPTAQKPNTDWPLTHRSEPAPAHAEMGWGLDYGASGGTAQNCHALSKHVDCGGVALKIRPRMLILCRACASPEHAQLVASF